VPVRTEPRESHPAPGPDARLLAAFTRLGGAFAHAASRHALASTAWTHLQPWLPPAALVVYVVDEDGAMLTAASVGGSFDPGLDRADGIPVGERLSGWVAATGQSVLNSDARLDFDPAARDASILQSAAAVPIFDADGPAVGVLALYARQPDAFSEAHRLLLQAAADALSVPLATARRAAPLSRRKVS
jgi:GAF domain-containing protein